MNFFYDLIQINEYTYSLKIHGHNIIPLYQTIINMLKNAYYDNETETIIFTAENIKPLKNILFNKNDNKMGLNQCIKMIDELTKQISYLKTINYGFYGFDINDILVIDGIFLFCNTQYLFPLYKDNFLFIEPLSQPYFSSPEIIKLTILPTEINNKCSYYSLGVLVVFCLLNNYLLVSNELKTPKEIENIMKPIFNTKIYWFLKRCLEPNLEKRVLLLI